MENAAHDYPKNKRDVIIVLAGGINSDGSLPNIPKYRVEKGVELYKQKVAPFLLMSGSWSFMLDYVPPTTEAKAMRDYAIKLNVPEDKILLEEKSNDTIGNAYFTKVDFLIPKNWKNVCVVTSEFHMERTKYIFKKVLGPEYDIDFAEAPSKLTSLELKEKEIIEKKILTFTKKWMDKIKDGDDLAIKQLLYTEHPGYAKRPKYSKKQLFKMIEETEIN